MNISTTVEMFTPAALAAEGTAQVMVYLAITVIVFVLSGELAMAGVGAAFLFVPIFYWLGVPLAVASSTGLLLNAVSLSFASWTYWRAGLVNWRLGLPVTLTAVAAAPLGARPAGPARRQEGAARPARRVPGLRRDDDAVGPPARPAPEPDPED